MIAVSQSLIKRTTLNIILIDSSAMVFIFLGPAISHLISLPVYLIEPMRMMLIFALAHTSRRNAYLLAFTMPVFSYLISGHPFAPKMILIAFELALNVFLFYLLVKRSKSTFISILLSIVISKTFYYIIKIYLINLMVLNTEIISTPIFIQLITTFAFSLYLYKFYPSNKYLKDPGN